MSNINISDLEIHQDSTLFAECTPEEASAIGGGLWREILGAIGFVGGLAIGGLGAATLLFAAGSYLGGDIDG
jgi:hypothetical protein